MRNTFIHTLEKEALKNNNVMLITADLEYSVFEDFKKMFPKQYLNAGVAEQNATGVAAGLAMEGKIPFLYSIIPFITMRNYEQIRNDICYQNLNVKIVGVGSGFSYGSYGRTHHALEDIGIMRTIPNLTIFSPSDRYETERVVKLALQIQTPCYIRLGRAGEPLIHSREQKFRIGKGITIKNGTDVCLISTGTMVHTALEVASQLSVKNISSTVISMPTLKPIDRSLILKSVKKHKALFTIEDHSVVGGLGSIVAEIIAEQNHPIHFSRIGVPDVFTHFVGMQEYMNDKHNISSTKITKRIIHEYVS